MTEQPPIVFVVDDDVSIRDALKSLIRSVGLRVELFGSPREFLRAKRPDAPSCLVLDVRLPGESGLDLQRELAEANIHIPIIFITGHGDIPRCGPRRRERLNSSPSPSAIRICWMPFSKRWSETRPDAYKRQKLQSCGSAMNRSRLANGMCCLWSFPVYSTNK